MAAITAIDASQSGSFSSTPTTLTASDTITFNSKIRQLLVVSNETGGPLTLNIDGDGGTTVAVAGLGSAVSVTDGYDIVLADGSSRAVVLSSISHYCQGVVTLTGGSGMTVQLFNL